MIVLKTFLFSVIILQQWLCMEARSQCPSSTRCRKLRNCPAYSNSQEENSYIYCGWNHNETHVCCPTVTLRYASIVNENQRIVRECKSYQPIRRSCNYPLIVDGEPAKPKEYPFMALIFNKNGNDTIWLCGGTLISSRFVLTAAHCFTGTEEPNVVRLGELDYLSSDDDATPIDFAIKNYTLHPRYDHETHYNDIALIELDRQVQFSEYIYPACLPLSNGDINSTQLTAAGWGITGTHGLPSSRLLKVNLDHFDDATCRRKVLTGADANLNTDIQICAGSKQDHRDTCSGDSGGPLFSKHPDYNCMFLVFGVTTHSEGGCGNINYPSFYARVFAFIDWIERIVWN